MAGFAEAEVYVRWKMNFPWCRIQLTDADTILKAKQTNYHWVSGHKSLQLRSKFQETSNSTIEHALSGSRMELAAIYIIIKMQVHNSDECTRFRSEFAFKSPFIHSGCTELRSPSALNFEHNVTKDTTWVDYLEWSVVRLRANCKRQNDIASQPYIRAYCSASMVWHRRNSPTKHSSSTAITHFENEIVSKLFTLFETRDLRIENFSH